MGPAVVRTWPGPMMNSAIPRAFFPKEKTGVCRSEYKFDAECLAVAPDDLAWLAFRMLRHQGQYDPVADIDLGIGHDPGATRRDVQYEAVDLGHLLVDGDPGQPSIHLASRFARYLGPSSLKIHDGHPSLDPINQKSLKQGHQIEGIFVKFPLAHRLEIYRSGHGYPKPGVFHAKREPRTGPCDMRDRRSNADIAQAITGICEYRKQVPD
jgi:hypothetical protein